jgi:hypothetical protein
MYIIIKKIEQPNGVVLPVVILDANSEVWEFPTSEDAEHIRDIFERNSDSGYKYEVKMI